ncbi:phosphoglycerol transferase [Paenibacillus selenitireducens]|uniref:Phosphoglycerol transferase n=1 Tax=Paenibacillus selenitireducens TaxID=1324314 RepID=A0A1T2XMK7_9BACL|nr:LTA synthase family protein [Paenibacillus selenitireducens]OPA81097.1 phosphoglycerol transferase [Paenibacillus selenitireducens]
MNTPFPTAPRVKRIPLHLISRLPYAECMLFIVLIVYKLYLFDRFIAVPLVHMDKWDYVIGIGSIMLCSFWVWLLPKRGRWVSLFLLNLLLSTVFYADLVYYRYFQDFISIPVLLQAGQVSSLGDSIASLITWKDILFFVDLLLLMPITILVWIRVGRQKQRLRPLERQHGVRWRKAILRILLSAMIFTLGCVLTFMPIKQATNTWAKGIFAGNWWNVSLYNVTGLIGFHGYDINRYAQENWFSNNMLSAEEEAEVKQWFDAKHQQTDTKNDLFGAYKGKNIIVIQAEAFQNFMIHQKINGVEITPNLNKLIQESMYFSNFYHQTGQGRTSDADFSSHSSLHPLPTGSVFIRYPNHTYDMLPQILKDNGYATGVYHAYDASFWNRYIMYNHMGYDKFYSKKDFTIDEPLGWSLGDTSFFRQSLAYMEKTAQPFYSFLITLSSHHPYQLPASYQKLDVGEFKGTIFGDYLESVHYVDASLGTMIEQMIADGLWDNTILAFYGDHDNSIRDKAVMEQFLGTPINDLKFEQIMNQVPMLIHLPDGKHAATIDRVGGQLDMTPSLLYLLGIPTDTSYMMGNNLFTEDEKLVVLRSGAFTDGKVYYIPSADGLFKNGTCYDAATGEKQNVSLCQAKADQAKKQLEISDKTITYDLIRKFRETP